MTKCCKTASSMVYTPNSHIPIGEAIKLPDGSNGLRIKNPRTNKLDEISLDALIQDVCLKAAGMNTAETRNAQGLASQ